MVTAPIAKPMTRPRSNHPQPTCRLATGCSVLPTPGAMSLCGLAPGAAPGEAAEFGVVPCCGFAELERSLLKLELFPGWFCGFAGFCW